MSWFIYIIFSTIIVFLISYISFLLKNIKFFGENINNLREEVEEYNVHLESLYGMEVFHGDETIKSMIEHTKHLSESIKDFEYFYSLLDNQETLEEDEEDGEAKTQNEKEEE